MIIAEGDGGRDDVHDVADEHEECVGGGVVEDEIVGQLVDHNPQAMAEEGTKDICSSKNQQPVAVELLNHVSNCTLHRDPEGHQNQ